MHGKTELPGPELVEYLYEHPVQRARIAQQLEAAGVPQAQARVHAQTLGDVLGNCVALSVDLREVKAELSHSVAEAETRLCAEIHDIKTELVCKIEIVEARLLAEIDKKFRFQKWSNGMIAALLIGLYIQLLVR